MYLLNWTVALNIGWRWQTVVEKAGGRMENKKSKSGSADKTAYPDAYILLIKDFIS